MCSRYVDAFVQGRQVTGSTLFQDSEDALAGLDSRALQQLGVGAGRTR